MKGLYKKKLKRIFDFTISSISLIILSPLIIIIALLVFLNLGSPIIFVQPRPGKNEKVFNMYKFRTLSNVTDDAGTLLPDEDRLTRFGKILRSTSLDELPGLVNIVKGDMSIVGPRPLLVSYLPLYNEKQRKRHDERPGLTGLAQINGRNTLNWEQRFELDIKYIENITFMNDLSIIFKTVRKVFIREGITGSETPTMTPFKGSSINE